MIDKVKEEFLDKGIPLNVFLLDAHWQVDGWDAPAPLAAPGKLNAPVPGTQDYVSTARLANGETMVVWQSPHAEFDGEFSPPRRVMLQRLDSAGNKVGHEAQIHLNPDFRWQQRGLPVP